jgi:hypothetical protein
MSNVNKWNSWFKDLPDAPSAYRFEDSLTYVIGANFLRQCKTVEDWGSGAGGFKRYLPLSIGVDGSDTPYAEKKFVDLEKYTSNCEGIFMRHVLEHNYQWENILTNAVNSATDRLCIVLFTPLTEYTIELAHNLGHGVDVPDLSLSLYRFQEIINSVNPKSITYENYSTATGYGQETVVYIQK